jgi:PHD/YefM family antitoxin component YafN of YafNO toxin-antitoxin module
MEGLAMGIALTEHQLQSLDVAKETPARVVDPRTNQQFVLVPAAEYESIREILEEERRQAIIRRIGRRNAMLRMEDEP